MKQTVPPLAGRGMLSQNPARAAPGGGTAIAAPVWPFERAGAEPAREARPPGARRPLADGCAR